MTQMLTPTVRRTPKRWTKQEYNEAVEKGWLQDKRAYLYRGEIFQRPPTSSLHAQGSKRLNYWLMETFRPNFEVRPRRPFELRDESMPEYWIINVRDRQIEGYRQPVSDPSSGTGHRYSHWKIHNVGESVTSLVRPDISVTVARLADVS